jgi:tRNA threonylcarbamoyladenosine biosynthesis protein TsaB
VNLLAFDTSTERLSAALQAGGRVRTHEGEGGAQASSTLLPVLQQLLADAGLALKDLDAIVFGRGPGSFTGLRTACAVAQGLGFGAGVPVLGVATLLAVAEEARATHGTHKVVAVLDARMDELYVARYEYDAQRAVWHECEAPALLRPEELAVAGGWTLAGNAGAAFAGRLPAPCLEAWPRAAALLAVAPALVAAGQARPAAEALPLYVRDKVAQTTQERAARAAGST